MGSPVAETVSLAPFPGAGRDTGAQPPKGERNMREPEPERPERPEAEKASAGDAELRARLEALKSDLGGLQAGNREEGARRERSQVSGSAMATGLRAGSELAAAVLVGAGTGYLLDRGLGTKPLFLIVFLMVGMAAGFLNIYRMGVRMGRGSGNGT